MPARLKILMVSYTSFLQQFYQTLPHEIARQSGADVQVLVPPYWKELWSRGRLPLQRRPNPLFELQAAPVWFTGNLHFAFFRNRLKDLIKSFQPDVIDLENEPFNLGSYQMARYRERFAPDSQLVLHASQNRFKRYPPPFNWVERYVLGRSDAVLVRNAVAGDVLRQKGYRGLMKVVTHGVDTDAFEPRPQPELRRKISPNGRPTVGFVGSLVAQKGLPHLLEAAAELPVTVLIVGGGEEKERLTQLAEQLDMDVYFAPPASHAEVSRYMNAMDIFVLPSLTFPHLVEKFGRVLIEAMACGTPVVGSSSGEIPNVIGDAGLVFQEGDSAALREKLVQLLNDDRLRDTLAEKGRQRATRRYSWNAVAAQTLQVYEQVLSAGRDR